MKTKLLLLLLCVSALGYSQTFDNIPTGTGIYLNKVIMSPNNGDLTRELLEIRGTPNAVIPSDLWFLVIEGDANAGNYGKVTDEMNIGDGVRTFGANGIFAIMCNYTDENTAVVTTNPYEALMDPQANYLVIELTGNDVNGGSNSNTSTQTPDIGYDGNFADATGSYMLISGSDPDGVVIDADLDGNIDAAGDHTSWVLYDSVAFMDDDLENGGPERAYAQIVFAQENSTIGASQTATASANVIDFNWDTDAHIIFRQGTSTGYTIDDWVIGDTSGDYPDWEMDTETLPAAFVNWAGINTVYGALNPTAATLSVDSPFASSFKIYPNPASDYIQIESNNVQISSVEMYSVLGKKVVSQKTLINNRLDVSNLSKGVYFMKINADGGSATKKVVVQ